MALRKRVWVPLFDCPTGGAWYRIVRLTRPLKDYDGAHCMAVADDEQRVIWLDPLLTDAQASQVILNAIGELSLETVTAT